MHPFVEAIAAFFGVAGTLLLATRSRWARWGFACYLMSNFGWLAFSWSNGHIFMFWQQVAFTVSSVVGIYFWFFKGAKS